MRDAIMADTIFVNGVVIPCGLADHEGDVLNKTDIKKIFTKYINRDTDTMHTRIKNEGVEVLANWISEVDTVIDGKTAPAGSWLATFKITNEELIKSINEGKITGLSLGSVSDVALTQDYWFINKSINYKDLDDMEEVIPLFISFVDLPSNQFGLDVMDYEVYINKRADESMTDKTNDEKISISTLEKVRDLFGINKAETAPVDEDDKMEEEEIDKVETPATDDITNKELLEQIGGKVEEGVLSAFKKLAEARTESAPAVEEPAVDKAEEDEEKDKPAEETEPEKDDKKEEEEKVEINKRATVKTENVEQPNTSTNFYKQAGRDEFGCRIR